MVVTRVNTASIGGYSTAAVAYSTTLGTTASVGDLIVVTAASNGTRVVNGITVSDNINGAYTTIAEQQQGATTRYSQTFYKVVTAAMAATDTITCTPYASNTGSVFVVDIFRGVGSTLSRGPVSGSTATAATTAPCPALPSAPPAGDLVWAMSEPNGGTFTIPAGYTQGSVKTGGTPNACHGWALADGASTYGGTWTFSTSQTSAEQTMAFSAGGSAAPPRPVMRVMQAVNRSVVF